VNGFPTRVQLSRRPGYRKPAEAVVVTRSSKHWGNPTRSRSTAARRPYGSTPSTYTVILS
jgi:hypothetical protein